MKKVEIELSDTGYEILKAANENYNKKKKTKEPIEYTAANLVAIALLLIYTIEKTDEKHEKTNKN